MVTYCKVAIAILGDSYEIHGERERIFFLTFKIYQIIAQDIDFIGEVGEHCIWWEVKVLLISLFPFFSFPFLHA